MKYGNRIQSWAMCAGMVLTSAFALPASPQAGAQSTQSAAQARRQAQTEAAQPPSEKDIADIQEQMLKLLRLSPVLTTVVAHDPSLLADQAYVERNNPELAQFITEHPDIAKNPEFYLFSHLDQGHGRREQALERAVWPDLAPPDRPFPQSVQIMHDLIPMIIAPCLILAVVWVVRILVESLRWNRTFRLQSEVHSRLIDRFTSSQDLAAYMQTEAGRRFLEASPVALGTDMGVRMPNVVARILTPLTVGIVMVLSGFGFIAIRNSSPDTSTPLYILGILALMPGIGFILSAGATWVVAKRLGMLPEKVEFGGTPPPHINSIDRP
jgi:hypothetical protein